MDCFADGLAFLVYPWGYFFDSGLEVMPALMANAAKGFSQIVGAFVIGTAEA